MSVHIGDASICDPRTGNVEVGGTTDGPALAAGAAAWSEPKVMGAAGVALVYRACQFSLYACRRCPPHTTSACTLVPRFLVAGNVEADGATEFPALAAGAAEDRASVCGVQVRALRIIIG